MSRIVNVAACLLGASLLTVGCSAESPANGKAGVGSTPGADSGISTPGGATSGDERSADDDTGVAGSDSAPATVADSGCDCPPDSGSPAAEEAGVTIVDTGVAAADTGVTAVDTGSAVDDTGVTPADTGVAAADTETDTGTIVAEVGADTAPADAGHCIAADEPCDPSGPNLCCAGTCMVMDGGTAHCPPPTG